MIRRINQFLFIILLITACNREEFSDKEHTYVLLEADLKCDFFNDHFIIDSVVGNSALANKIVLPTFRRKDITEAQRLLNKFKESYKNDTLFYHKVVVKGYYSKSPHNISADVGCEGAHSILITDVLSVERVKKRNNPW